MLNIYQTRVFYWKRASRRYTQFAVFSATKWILLSDGGNRAREARWMTWETVKIHSPLPDKQINSRSVDGGGEDNNRYMVTASGRRGGPRREAERLERHRWEGAWEAQALAPLWQLHGGPCPNEDGLTYQMES
ncbi:hypothetical protein NDU88_004105 [Pleurodeles waltl]|uniref:Uncharacterized protein n=1 Tax=Pleurodeles waltl TaxID=8319 RepID=A0AAV7L0G7_PLEWA|nr:hypothetical protein NDU88_004105 [Pleurodeles waltl]